MKKIAFLIAIAVFFYFSFTDVFANKKTVKIFYIGNSLTFANNLPGMVASIAKSHGYKMVGDAYTPGGARLLHHASNPKIIEKIERNAWDFVVFQEHGQYPGFSIRQLSTDVFPFAKRLTDIAKKANPDSTIVFYMTMARRDGDPDNTHVSSELLTYEGMQRRVNSTYMAMARDNDALVVPVGKVWEVIRREKPNLNLYADNVHPNRLGTYLAACVFFTTLFGEPSFGSPIPDGVDKASARYIQKVVDRIVLEQ